jgi:hypothetical protein
MNWVPTVPGKAWFAYFRFSGPLEAYFDKSWPLPDIEKGTVVDMKRDWKVVYRYERP